MKNIEKAISLLIDEKTCVIVKDDIVYTSEKKGVAPVISFIEEGIDMKGFAVADRIVGKAAALLFVYSEIKEAYGEVMSESGIEILKKYHIPFSYKTKTDVIINRKGDDICPMEKTVIDIDDPQEAYIALKEKNSLLNK